MTNKPNTIILLEHASNDTVQSQISLPHSLFQLERVPTLEAALELLPTGQVTALLIDFSLLNTPDFPSLHALRSAHPDMPLILFGDDNEERLTLDAMQSGADDYLLKEEISSGMLVRAVRYAMEWRRAERAEAALRRSEERLRQSEALFGKVFHTSPIAMIISRFDNGRVIDVNKSYEAMRGHRREDAVGRTVVELNLFPSYDERNKLVERLREQGSIHNYETTIDTASGEQRNIMRFLELFELEDQHYILGMLLDTTDREQAQEEVKEWKDRYEAVIMASGHILYDWDLRTDYVTYGGSFQQILGYSPDAISGDLARWLEFIHPDDQAYFSAEVERAVAVKDHFRLEYRMCRCDGQCIVVQDDGYFILDNTDNIVRLVGFVVDITERKQADELLEFQTKRLQLLSDIDRSILAAHSSAEVVEVVLRKIQQLVPANWANIGFIDEKMGQYESFTLSRNDLDICTSNDILLGPEMMQQVADPETIVCDDIRQAPEIWQRVAEFHLEGVLSILSVPLSSRERVQGRLTLASEAANAFTSDHRQIADQVAAQLAVALQQNQLYEQVQLQSVKLEQRVSERTEQLEAANKELEAFAYSVSHDLRAPLRAIDGFSRIVLDDYAASIPDDGLHYLKLVRDNAQQMGTLIDDLLAFARLSRKPLTTSTVPHSDIVHQCVNDLLAEQAGRQINIRIDTLPSSAGDPVLMKQVWLNLLSNAIKYTRRRDQAVIIIGSYLQDGEVVYFVQDNGVGFDMRYGDKLFGVFQRMHRAEEYEGTGVGLAIVQRIIHRHEGHVWAEAAVERGATFYFTVGGGRV